MACLSPAPQPARGTSRMLMHRPVMLTEALAGLAVRRGGTYLDGTFGRGGHSGAILEALGGSGMLHALDRDPEAGAEAWKRYAATPNFRFHARNFAEVGALAAELGIADVLQDGQVLIAGAVRTENDSAVQAPRYYNSIYVIDSQGQIIGAADKVHLVPFGEYLPFESFWNRIGLTSIAAEIPGGYSAAPRHHILTMPDGTKLLPLVCYEVIFPDETAEFADQADAIVNLTNDGWFGYTPGPWQHFFQARLRAVETGLPVIRNSNSGISALINARGEIISGLDFQSKGYLDVALPAKIVPFLNSTTRATYFWLLECLLVLIAFFTRLSFVFKRN